jgi:CRISPR/Cas system Type II protein with McrA/HNH and RuvC-like nuclease domain
MVRVSKPKKWKYSEQKWHASSRTFWIKKRGGYLKDRINEIETNSKNKNEICKGIINAFKKTYSPRTWGML